MTMAYNDPQPDPRDWDATGDDGPCCEKCGNELDYVECDACGGDGYFEDYDDEIMEECTETCETCEGKGGWSVCFDCNKQERECDALETAAPETPLPEQADGQRDK